MAQSDSLPAVVRLLIENPGYLKTLTRQIEVRTADPQLVEQLIAYARSREVSAGHAKVRRVLTEAGVSWEAL